MRSCLSRHPHVGIVCGREALFVNSVCLLKEPVSFLPMMITWRHVRATQFSLPSGPLVCGLFQLEHESVFCRLRGGEGEGEERGSATKLMVLVFEHTLHKDTSYIDLSSYCAIRSPTCSNNINKFFPCLKTFERRVIF